MKRGPGDRGSPVRWTAAAIVAVAVAVMPEAGAAQHAHAGAPEAGRHPAAGAETPQARTFVRTATEATRRFADRGEAIRAGYRKLGPDFPGMGEHWVHPGRIVRGVLDPAAPPVLSYVEVEGEPVLVGIAFTLPLDADEAPPAEPLGREVWHDHSGAVDEETLLLNHPSSMHDEPGGPRLSMVHVWTDLENPDGILAQNNWRLPWTRVGLPPPPEPSTEAARGVSLAYGGRAFYRELIGRAADLTPEEELRVEAAVDQWSGRAESLVEAARGNGGGPVSETEAFTDAWTGFWDAVRAGVGREQWARLAPLSGAL